MRRGAAISLYCPCERRLQEMWTTRETDLGRRTCIHNGRSELRKFKNEFAMEIPSRKDR